MSPFPKLQCVTMGTWAIAFKTTKVVPLSRWNWCLEGDSQFFGIQEWHQVPPEILKQCASGCSVPVLQTSTITWLPPGFSCSFTTLTTGAFFFSWDNHLMWQSPIQETFLERFVHAEWNQWISSQEEPCCKENCSKCIICLCNLYQPSTLSLPYCYAI